MKIKLQCCNCHSAEKGEQLYEYDHKIYCSICCIDALSGIVKLSGYADMDEIEVEDEE